MRMTDGQVRQVRCAAGHAGNRALVRLPGGDLAECQGCGAFYRADEVIGARPGHNGEGGVILARGNGR